MDHPAAELLEKLRRGEVTPAERSGLESHLSTCPTCAKQLQTQQPSTADLARAKALYGTGKLQDAVAVAQRAVDGAVQVGYRPLQADALVQLGTMQSEIEVEVGMKTLEKSVWANEASRQDVPLALTLSNMVRLNEALGRVQESARWIDFAQAAVERLGKVSKVRVDYLEALAQHEVNLGRCDGALTDMRDALELAKQVYTREDVELGRAYHQLANLYRQCHHYEESYDAYQNAVAIRDHLFGPQHPETLRSELGLGLVYHDTGRSTQGLPYLRKVVEGYSPHSLNQAIAQFDLGEALYAAGQSREARANLEDSIRLTTQKLGPNNAHICEMWEDLALMDFDDEARAQAQADGQQALSCYRLVHAGDNSVIRLESLLIAVKQPSTAVQDLTHRLAALRSGPTQLTDRGLLELWTAQAFARAGNGSRSRSLAAQAATDLDHSRFEREHALALKLGPPTT